MRRAAPRRLPPLHALRPPGMAAGEPSAGLPPGRGAGLGRAGDVVAVLAIHVRVCCCRSTRYFAGRRLVASVNGEL